jgi:hypothetical protein
MVYADASRPGMVDGFTRKTFIAMVEGVRGQALKLGLIDAETWAKGIRDLNRTTESDGVFCYTFFKGIGVKLSSGVLDQHDVNRLEDAGHTDGGRLPLAGAVVQLLGRDGGWRVETRGRGRARRQGKS